MTLTITMELDNAAFDEDEDMAIAEVSRILSDLCERITINRPGKYNLRDVNGNWIGIAQVEAV